MLQWDSGQICLSALNHEASRQYVLNSALFEDVIFLFMLPNSSRPTPRGKPTVEITQYKLIGLCKCPFAAHMLSPLRQAITMTVCNKRHTFHSWCVSTCKLCPFWRERCGWLSTETPESTDRQRETQRRDVPRSGTSSLMSARDTELHRNKAAPHTAALHAAQDRHSPPAQPSSWYCLHKRLSAFMLVSLHKARLAFPANPTITESLRLEDTFKIIQSNHQHHANTFLPFWFSQHHSPTLLLQHKGKIIYTNN